MKRFATVLAKSIAIETLSTVKIATVGTLGLASCVMGTVSNGIVAGCNTGIRKLKGHKTSYADNLEYVHDLKHLGNKIMDGRVTVVEAYDSVVPEQWKMVIDYLQGPYKKAAMDINSARTAQ